MAEILVPLAACAYMLLCLGALAIRLEYIPKAFGSIVAGAFSPRAATGGAVGSGLITLRIGISRGIFTNEAGMGTASIAHGSAHVKYPWEQGYMGIMEVVLDTIVMCTMTALVILSADISISYGQDTGILLTLAALESVFGRWVGLPITLFLSLFAFATVLGWGLYGGRCAQYLLGDGAWKKFVIFQGFAVAISAVLECRTVWTVSEILNGCMAIPNLLALAFLSREVRAMSEKIPGR
jgi:AGCS family alanine or glycine:cation symporter